MLQGGNCESAFALTFTTAFQAWQSTLHDPSALFYIKEEEQTRGVGMQVVARDKLLTLRLSQSQIIQQAIQDIQLIDGRKFVIRYYLLFHNKKLFLHRRGAVIVHGELYDRQSTDHHVQIMHDFDQPVPKARLLVMHAQSRAREWHSAIARRIYEIMPALKPLIDASSQDCYALIGGDALIEASGQARLLEFNHFPAMFAKCKEFNEIVSQAVLHDLIGKVLLGASNEFDELQQPPSTCVQQSCLVDAGTRYPMATASWYPPGPRLQGEMTSRPLQVGNHHAVDCSRRMQMPAVSLATMHVV
eukprot:CAMPEP_0197664304 /NCGR_PEP_ID=MMETSP1338-20131121/58552_1 /TAXON_ID=43686 ORGANISM="Pelagodinium beii, Strain RCC1491" /NCGR_SAMPLE_ID=MMETSP1338 /ASSEMBLY_ACC=CAM_ASM_000754 /LENGTH=301 /DNA_ID=CAMNT_0043242917 /DNA_START=271 /DNA_END=1176 /DNA_ORIENTATION=-